MENLYITRMGQKDGRGRKIRREGKIRKKEIIVFIYIYKRIMGIFFAGENYTMGIAKNA